LEPTARAAPADFTRRFTLQPSLGDWIILGYGTLVSLAIALAPDRPGKRFYLFYVLAVTLGYAAFVAAYRRIVTAAPNRLATAVYRLAPIACVSAIFFRLRHIIPLVNPNEYDRALHAIDVAVLGRDLSVAVERIATPGFVEWNAFWYSLYFPVGLTMILCIAFLDKDDLRRTRWAVGTLVVFCVGHFTYLLVPGLGPVAYLRNAYAVPRIEGGFFMQQVWRTYAAGPRHDIFPSLHTALPAWWVLYLVSERASRVHRWALVAIVPVAVDTWMATIVLRWHYAVDLLAGFALAFLALAVARRSTVWYERLRAEAGVVPAYW
jgi:hypothetical protein